MNLNYTYVFAAIMAAAFIAIKIYERPRSPRMYDPDTPEGRKEAFFEESRKVSSLVKVLLILTAVVGGFIVVLFDAVTDDYWLIFGSERTSKIETQYGITVNSDVDLKSYRKWSLGQGGRKKQVKLKCSIDGMDFIEKNCNGTLFKYAEDDQLHFTQEYIDHLNEKGNNRENYTAESTLPYPLDEWIDGKYWYSYKNEIFYMTVKNSGDSYEISIE